MITERELATILAALRFWQEFRDGSMGFEFTPIASDEGQFVPLNDEEIDVLAERLNFGGSN